MIGLLFSLFLVNVCTGAIGFMILFRRRKNIQDRFATILAQTMSGTISFNLALIVFLMMGTSLVTISIITTMIGCVIGICFGMLVKFHSVLSGLTHGITGGLMGSMLGAVILDPSLCSLPAAYIDKIAHNTILFSSFGTLITFITTAMVIYALRV
ncbi:hypothetical protein [Salirhabdus sp. Marseille-P4669]|uniref:hypothetical protein n=1 Tax=Salirhabdus sp. Marseille-P4669 TaxID=2042310 RepID=UPI000C7CF7D3|nr:hypothetical protein [Salirhabdus sp. Marseille-P4669]